jgi:putative transposase
MQSETRRRQALRCRTVERVGAAHCDACAESGTAWNTFFKDLVARGLQGVALVTFDAHTGLVDAVGANLPGATWQRCRTHYTVNLMSVCPQHAWGGVKAMRHSVFDQIDSAAVHAQYDKLLDSVRALPEVQAHLDAARDEVLAFTSSPKACGDRSGPTTPTSGSTARSAADRRRRHLPRPQLHHPARRRGPAEQHDEWADGRRYLGLDILSRSRLALIPSTDDKGDSTGAISA